MSDTDPVLEHLRCRRALLLRQIDDANARIDEIDTLITTLTDGRHRIAKRRKASLEPIEMPTRVAGSIAVTEPEETA